MNEGEMAFSLRKIDEARDELDLSRLDTDDFHEARETDLEPEEVDNPRDVDGEGGRALW